MSDRSSEEHGVERLRLQAWTTAIAFVALTLGWVAPHVGVGSIALPLLLVAYVAGGWDATATAWAALRERALDVDLLMLLAALGAAVVGHWLEGAVLLFLFSLGNTLETFAFRRTRRSIEALVELRPDRAARIGDGFEKVVPLDVLRPGDVVRVRPGDRIPVDGTVVVGTSRIDESTLTGEPVPVSKGPGSTVFAGTLNGSGSLDVTMTRAADETTLARIIRLVEDARDARAPTQNWIEQVESRYAAGVIVLSGLAVLVPWLILGWSFDDAFYRAMTLLVVASPCALVISIPATIVSAVSNGARHGILFKGGAHLDALADVRAFALDKTGTLTVGRPEVVAVIAAGNVPVGATGLRAGGASWTGPAGAGSTASDDEDGLVRLAAAVESRSEHHLAAAILRSAESRSIAVPEPDVFDSVAGQGVRASVDGVEVFVGRRSWVEEGAAITPTDTTEVADELRRRHPSATPVHVATSGRYLGAFAIQDHPRPGARAAVEALAKAGIAKTVLLTGDATATGEAIAREVGIATVLAELDPTEKRDALARLRVDYGPVAMVGDGVNDAPALADADVGIAIGAAGTDVALDTADVVVMGEDLETLARAVRLSHRTRRIVRQNLAFAVGVMIVLVGAALTGVIGLTAGVIGHEGSTIVVVFNGLRLLADRS